MSSLSFTSLTDLDQRTRQLIQASSHSVDGWQQRAGAHRAELISLRKQLLWAEAQLRRQDGTLKKPSVEWIQQLINQPSMIQRHRLPVGQRVIVREVRLASGPLPGHYVLSIDDPRTANVLLYSLSDGLEEFATLSALEQGLHARLKQPITDFPVLANSPFDHVVDNVLQQRANNPSLDLMTLLNITGVQRTRYQQLWLRQLPDWLNRASPAQQSSWLEALRNNKQNLDDYNDHFLPITEYGQRPMLLYRARTVLIEGLKRLGVTGLDPDEILLNTTSAMQTGPSFWSGSFSPSSYIAGASLPRTGPVITLTAHQCTLTQLALENQALLDPDFWITARLSDLTGNTLQALTPTQVRTLVREVDFAHHYDRWLKHQFEQPAHRDHFERQWLTQFKLDRLEAGLNGELPPDDAMLTVDPLTVKISQLYLVGFPVLGVLALHIGDSPQRVLYTPGAADRQRFKRYATEWSLLQDLAHREWHRYLAARVLHQKQDAALQDLRGPSHTLTLYAITGAFFDTQYLLHTSAARDNARLQARSTGDLVWYDVKTAFLFLLDAASFVLPFKFMIPLAITRSLWATFKSLQAVSADDREAALHYFLEALTHLLDASSDLAGGTLLRRQPLPDTSLDRRYALDSAPANLRARNSEGVYPQALNDGSRTRYFIEEAGRYFEARRLLHNDAWHLVNPRNPTGTLGQPVVQQLDGRWKHTWIDRLPGGNDREVGVVEWGDSYVDSLKDQSTLRALKRIRPQHDKATIEAELRSFNMNKRQRLRLTDDIDKTSQIPPWAEDYRRQSMDPANPERFTELKVIVDNMLQAMRKRAGFQPSGDERVAILNRTEAYLDDFAAALGYGRNVQDSYFRTDVPALLRGDTHSPAELAADGALLGTPGSHYEQYTTGAAIPAALNRLDAQVYANDMDRSNLSYNSQRSELPVSLPEDPGGPDSPRDPDSPLRLNQRQGFLYLIDTRGLETVGVADNVVLNPRESHLVGGVVASEVHISAPADGIPVDRLWLMHSRHHLAVRLDRLDDHFGGPLQDLGEATYSASLNRADYDDLIERMPASDQLAVSFDTYGVVINPFIHSRGR